MRDPKFEAYAHPERLGANPWPAARLDHEAGGGAGVVEGGVL